MWQPKIKVQKYFLEKHIVVTLRAQGAGWDWVGLWGSWETKVLSPVLGDIDRVWPSKSSWRHTHTAPWWSFCHPAKIFKGSLTLAKPCSFSQALSIHPSGTWCKEEDIHKAPIRRRNEGKSSMSFSSHPWCNTLLQSKLGLQGDPTSPT